MCKRYLWVPSLMPRIYRVFTLILSSNSMNSTSLSNMDVFFAIDIHYFIRGRFMNHYFLNDFAFIKQPKKKTTTNMLYL